MMKEEKSQVDDGARRRSAAAARSPAPSAGARAPLNRVELSGRLLELGALRYTPAGVAGGRIQARGTSRSSDEAGGKRKVQAEVDAVAFEAQARLLAAAAAGQ